MPRDYKTEMDRVLEQHGGFYTYEDILGLIETGRMQSFAEGDTWVVTQVHEFPRKKVLEIAFVIGNIEDLHKIEPKLEAFKKEIGADMLTATGRVGWSRRHFPGWEATSLNFVKV